MMIKQGIRTIMLGSEEQLESRDGESGFTLIEVLVSMLILSVMSLGVAMNTLGALRTAKFTEINHAASTLAISKMEEFAAMNVSALSSSLDATETAVTWSDFQTTFTRTSIITENADDSRTVNVTVSSNNPKLATTVEFETTFVDWE